ncbi:MAG: protein translocase subunit SecF [Planctomycetota bacterium]|nr:protein translocase subunit SecF [Planctomycetota bacterium]
MTFGQGIAGRTLEFRIRQAAEGQEVRIPLTGEDIILSVIPEDANWRIDDAKGYTQWKVALGVNKQDAAKILTNMKNNLTTTPVWPSSSKIGERVAGDTQVLAVVALLASFVGIAIYVWVRFQHLIFGIGAVASLVHDVLITVAAVAFSYWLAGVLGFLLVEEVKIDLNIIAALLTIVGYSINDTIVVFDRVREVRGKSPELTAELFNKSLNQTLSRTILTTTTVFLVVLILYFFGGAGIHGFAYAMLIGTITGAYSTIYVASPVVLWMTPKKKAANNQSFGR